MCFIEALDNSRKFYHTKEISNLEFKKLFDNMSQLKDNCGGTLGLHWNVIESILEPKQDGCIQRSRV
jgi:hypothetical protein